MNFVEPIRDVTTIQDIADYLKEQSPKYYVMTEYGVTEGWYNPDVKCWYALLWFMDGRFEEWNINIDKGDIPKLVKNVPVIAWMPLPQPYKAESEG